MRRQTLKRIVLFSGYCHFTNQVYDLIRQKAMAELRKRAVLKRGTWEVTKKLLKAIPIVGSVFAVGFGAYDIKKKGLAPGVVHVGLDMTPWVGTAKNIVEIFTGDLIPDKTPLDSTKPAEVDEQPAKQVKA